MFSTDAERFRRVPFRGESVGRSLFWCLFPLTGIKKPKAPRPGFWFGSIDPTTRARGLTLRHRCWRRLGGGEETASGRKSVPVRGSAVWHFRLSGCSPSGAGGIHARENRPIGGGEGRKRSSPVGVPAGDRSAGRFPLPDRAAEAVGVTKIAAA
jgi:hypothetical protein